MKAIFLFFILSLFTIRLCANCPVSEPWGPDADLTGRRFFKPFDHSKGNAFFPDEMDYKHELCYMKVEKRPIEKCNLTIAQQSCRKLIHFFQHYISDIDGPRSSFYPTSSQYALDAIVQFGVMKGIAMGCDRLMRENKEDWVYERTDKHGMERKIDPFMLR